MTGESKNNLFYDILFILYLAFYSFASFLFLEDFPHLNETQAPPGPPLALLEQAIALHVPGLRCVRLPAFFCAVLTLILMYALSARILRSRGCGLLSAVFASLSVMFVAASHQDLTVMVLLPVLLLLTLFHIASLQRLRPVHAVLTGLAAGAAAMFSLYFLSLFSGFLSLYLFYCFRTGRSLRLIADYILAFLLSSVITLILKAAIAFTFPVKPAFSSHTASLFSFYTLFPELNAAGSPIAYVPPVQFMAALCGVSVIAGLYLVLKERHLPVRYSYTAILYILLGLLPLIFLMRALNPFSFLLPLLLSCSIIPYALINAPKRFIFPIGFFLICCSLAVTASAALPFMQEPYNAYASAASSYLDKNAVILGPYNARFILPSSKNTVFYRDIPGTALTLPAMRRFIRQNGITHIIMPEEMEMIRAASPRYDSVYGQMPYYSALRQFLESDCKRSGSFESSYGMNIARYYWQKPWRVEVYSVL